MTRLLLLSLVVVAAPLARAADLRPFPQHVAYASGTIRPSHQTQAQQDAAVRTYYDQWKADFLTTDGTGNPSHWRVRFGKTAPDSAVTVSEGQGCGMVIVAIMAGYDAAAQTIFDGLWGFTRANPSIIDARLMGWKIPPDDPGGSCGPEKRTRSVSGSISMVCQNAGVGPPERTSRSQDATPARKGRADTHARAAMKTLPGRPRPNDRARTTSAAPRTVVAALLPTPASSGTMSRYDSRSLSSQAQATRASGIHATTRYAVTAFQRPAIAA